MCINVSGVSVSCVSVSGIHVSGVSVSVSVSVDIRNSVSSWDKTTTKYCKF